MESFVTTETASVLTNSYTLEVLARFERRRPSPLRQIDFLLLDVLTTLTQLPIIDFAYPGRFVAPQPTDNYSAFFERTAGYRIMFDSYGYKGFVRPMPTRFDGATQVGIVDPELPPIIDPGNGLAVGGIRAKQTVIKNIPATLAVITQLQAKKFSSPEVAKQSLTYLKWRQLLIFYFEQIVFFFNSTRPTLPFDYIGLTPHPHRESDGFDKNEKAAQDSGMSRLTPVIVEENEVQYYIKPVSRITPHIPLQTLLGIIYDRSRAHLYVPPPETWDMLKNMTRGLEAPVLRQVVRTDN